MIHNFAIFQILVRRIDNDGTTVWSSKIGDGNKNANQKAYSIGFSIAEVVGDEKNQKRLF